MFNFLVLACVVWRTIQACASYTGQRVRRSSWVVARCFHFFHDEGMALLVHTTRHQQAALVATAFTLVANPDKTTAVFLCIRCFFKNGFSLIFGSFSIDLCAAPGSW
jgi:hypothetical protein